METSSQKIENLVQQYLSDIKKNVAEQCYLECLAVECGEGECTKAIKAKFNL